MPFIQASKKLPVEMTAYPSPKALLRPTANGDTTRPGHSGQTVSLHIFGTGIFFELFYFLRTVCDQEKIT